MELSEDESIEFFKDGTFVIYGDAMNLVGEFKFVDTNRIKVQFGGLGALAGPVVMTVAISGDEMTWTSSDGKVQKWKRKK